MMTKLQKDSLVNLAAVGVSIVVSVAAFSIMRSTNAQGFDYVLIFLVVSGFCGVAGAIYLWKYYRKLDERQLMVCFKANRISTAFFVVYILVMSFIAFFVIGGGGRIDVFYLPVTVIVGLFLAQLVESAVLFILDSVE
jgi:hypothetical protein